MEESSNIRPYQNALALKIADNLSEIFHNVCLNSVIVGQKRFCCVFRGIAITAVLMGAIILKLHGHQLAS